MTRNRSRMRWEPVVLPNPIGHDSSIASEFLFLFLVILGSNFNPIVGFPTDSLKSGGADYQTIGNHRKAVQPVKLNTGVFIP
jgi:hypothetical protein